MTLETFFEKFDLFADAPDAVAKMRELVLQLAVQGRLVSQSSTDEPADTLAASIAKDRAAFVKERGLTRQRAFGAVEDNQYPFALPSGWGWTRLGNLCRVQAGFAFQSAAFVQGDLGMPIIRIRDITKDRTQANYVGEYREEFLVDPGDYLVGMDGNFAVARWQGPRALLNQRVSRLQWYSHRLEPSFFAVALQHRLSELQGTKAYTTVDHLSSGQIEDAVVPLPPLAEQKRIVAKVEELMALCDRLEAQRQERETRERELARASLARFADAPNVTNLEYLFHKSYAIPPADLRKSILTLAVQGHLSGTPASVVEEQTELLDSATDPQFPISYGVLKPGPQVPNGVRLVKSQHIRDWKVSEDIEYLISAELDAEFKRTKIKGGEVLLNLVGASIGRCAIAPSSLRGANVSRAVAVITLRAEVDPKFFLILLTAAFTPERIEALSSGTAQPVLNLGVIRKMKIWLPLLAEQRRIVAKVDELMALVDALETQLATAHSTAANLLTAAVAELTTA